MYIDRDALKTDTAPKLIKINQSLSAASFAIESCKVPEDFCYYQYMSSLSQDILDIKNSALSFASWIGDKIRSFEDAEDRNGNCLDFNGTNLLHEFWYTMYTGDQSDQDVLTAVYRAFEEAIESENVDAIKMLNKIIEVKKENPELNFVQDDYSYWQSGNWLYGKEDLALYDEFFDEFQRL